MISDKQLEANRNNAETDKAVRPYPRNTERAGNTSGQEPTTEAGKKRSSLNARRHGLTGQVTAMTDEDRTAHDVFSKALIQNLAPDGAMEVQLAQRIATDSWRLNRISAIEDNLFALGLHENGGALCPDHAQIDDALTTAHLFAGTARPYSRNGLAQTSTLGQHLQLLSLYEQRLNRAVQKNLALLQSLQATRKAQRESDLKEAASLLQLSEMKGLEYIPVKDGFVFSNDQIRTAIDRGRRLQPAAA